MGLPSAPNWVNVAHAGNAVNVLIDSHSSVHLAQIHVDLLAQSARPEWSVIAFKTDDGITLLSSVRATRWQDSRSTGLHFKAIQKWLWYCTPGQF
jgi:hypothetical protein